MQCEKKNKKAKLRYNKINRPKRVPTCSLSNFSWLISRSFFCNSSCCCWISSKCSNKSWRKCVTWPKASVLWLLPSWAISGSGDFVNGPLTLGWSCSFCISLLLLLFFTAVEDFDRKTRVNCRSDLELPALGGDLFPTKGASLLNWFWSMFPLHGKSVVITIWEIFVHVLSNTALKLFRFIRYNSGHHGRLADPCDINMANKHASEAPPAENKRRFRWKLRIVKAAKFPYFEGRCKNLNVRCRLHACVSWAHVCLDFEYSKLTKSLRHMTEFPWRGWSGNKTILWGRGANAIERKTRHW